MYEESMKCSEENLLTVSLKKLNLLNFTKNLLVHTSFSRILTKNSSSNLIE